MSTSTELRTSTGPASGLRATARRSLAARRAAASDRRARREFAQRLAVAGPSERSDLLAAANRAGL